MNPIGALTTVSATYPINTSPVKLHKVARVEEVLNILSKVGSNDLVVFDVDEVLITLKDRFLRPCGCEFADPIIINLFIPFSDTQKLNLFGEWISQVEVEVISQRLIDGIKEIQKKARVIALTRMMPGPGPCGKISLMEDLRFKELLACGIDFRNSFNIERMELGFPPKFGRVPLFKDGILYALPYNKGEVLEAFIDRTGTPKKVWFTDNDQNQVDDTAKSMLKKKIPYEGIQYLDQSLIDEEFDRQLGEFQFHHFTQTGVWLNDKSARSKMNNPDGDAS